MARILHIGDAYIETLEDLKEVLKRLFPEDGNASAPSELAGELYSSYKDNTLYDWLKEGNKDEKKMADQLMLIDEKEEESGIIEGINKVVTGLEKHRERRWKQYFENTGSSFWIDGEKKPTDQEVRLPKLKEVTLESRLRLKCLRSRNESFKITLSVGDKCLKSEIIKANDWREGSERDMALSTEFRLEKERSEVMLKVDEEEVDSLIISADLLSLQRFIVQGKNKDVSFNMIRVEGGSFLMPESEGYRVTLDDYYMAEVPVTQELWRSVMEGTGNQSPSRFKGDQLPVENVSWNDITGKEGFLDRLNQSLKGQLPERMRFTLPSEAQWAFAARGGVKHQGTDFTYSGSDNIDDVAWYDGNSGGKTQPVKLKKANELGLYDMIGNVWEWCQDWWCKDYPKGEFKNPERPDGGQIRVLRGGSWNYPAEDCRCTNRLWCVSDFRNVDVGLRLALSQLRPVK